MMTNLTWVRRYFAPHPDTAHLRTSSMKYVGKHAYVQYWDNGRHWGQIAALLGSGEHRVMLLHTTDFMADELSRIGYSFNPCASRTAYPLEGWWWWTERVTYPTTYHVEFHADDDFQGMSDAQIIDIMWDRFNARIRERHEHIDLCRRSKFRWAVRQLTGAFAAFATAFGREIETETAQMVRELNAAIEDTPENRHVWASIAARVGASHREELAAQRAERQRVEKESNVALEEFRAWLNDQPFYVRWEIELMLSGYSSYRLEEEYPVAEEFRKRILPDALRNMLRYERESRVLPYDSFATAFIDGNGTPKVFLLGRHWWDNETAELENVEAIDRVIAGLEQSVPNLPQTHNYSAHYTWRVEEFSNLCWELSRTAHPRSRYGAPANRVFSSLNRRYLVDRLKDLKARIQAKETAAG